MKTLQRIFNFTVLTCFLTLGAVVVGLSQVSWTRDKRGELSHLVEIGNVTAESGKQSVDWGKPEWGGGYFQMFDAETNLIVQIGLRDDGVVVWRKVKQQNHENKQ